MPSALPWLVDNASRMTNLSSFMATQPSREHQAAAAESVDEFASVNGDLFGTSFSTLDTKSERSRYYDVESDDAGFSTTTSQADPADEAPLPMPNGAASPVTSRGSSLRNSGHQRQLPDASPASLLGKIHQLQDQRDEMNSQLFNLRRSNETLQQDNMSLTAQNTTLQRQNAQSRQDTQDVKDQAYIARRVGQMIGRASNTASVTDATTQLRRQLEESQAIITRMRREKKQEEQNKQQLEAEKQKMENSWWGTVKYCGGTLGLVIAGAVAILVLDSCLQEDDAKRILVQRR